MNELKLTKNKMNKQSAILVLSAFFLAVIAYLLFRNIAIRADVTTGVGEIRVLVNNEVGVPLQTATVNITSDQTNQTFTITQKNDQGYYTAAVGNGGFTIDASSPGYLSDSQPTSVTGGQQQEINFFLQSE